MSSDSESKNLIVIGGGPSGLGAAILFAKQGFSVDIYDAAPDLSQADEESYPIGINPRGLKSIDLICKEAADEIRATGEISSWNIYNGQTMVATLPSDTTFGGPTRGAVVEKLFRNAKETPGVTFHFGHKLDSIDFESKTLSFKVKEEKYEEVEKKVDASKSRIIASDGVWSKTRREVVRTDPEFKCEVLPWNVEFRVLLSDRDPVTTLNPKIHYIFASVGIYVAVLKEKRWVAAMMHKKGDEKTEFLTSEDASEENITKLRAFIKEHIPLAESMFPDSELAEFFKRRTFTGAVVDIGKLNYGEWIVFLGDAAHSVLPPTGEGINSSLEDVTTLYECYKQDPTSFFELYNTTRLPDIQGLTDFAKNALANWFANPRRKVTNLAILILLSIGKKVGLVKEVWEDKSFGKQATTITPYREMHALWKSQVGALFPTIDWLVSWFV